MFMRKNNVLENLSNFHKLILSANSCSKYAIKTLEQGPGTLF